MDLVADWLQPLMAAVLNTALAIAVGVAVLRPAALSAAHAARLTSMCRQACSLLGFGLVGYWCAGTVAMTQTSLADLPASLWLVLTQSHFGAMLWVALAAWITLMVSAFSVALPARNTVLTLGLMGFSLARAATGHAADHGFLSIAVVIHTLHVLAATAWAGAVVVCVLLTPDWSGWPLQQRSALAHRLSEVATLALVAVVGTGLFNIARTLGQASHIWDSAYAWILLAKLIAVALAAALGVRNRWYWLAQLDDDNAAGAGGFRRILFIEMVLLLVVLAIAAKLGTTMPAQ
ncbi:copper resistance D family protein [Glaciimonas sp. GG7]